MAPHFLAGPYEPTTDRATSDGRSQRWWGRVAASLGALLLVSCGFGNYIEDSEFYSHTAIVVSPGAAFIRPGEDTTAIVTVMYLDGVYHSPKLTVVGTPSPGSETPAPPITASLTYLRDDKCPPAELPLGETDLTCVRYSLSVHTEARATGPSTITLSAVWGSHIERVGHFDLSFLAVPAAPDFAVDVLGVGPADPPVYATRALDYVQIRRIGGFSAPVTLTFDGMGSGITGTFTCEPTERCRLDLVLPAIFTAGGAPRLRVVASSGGVDRSVEFVQRIAPLFTVALSPASATLTSGAPLDIDVTIAVDPAVPMFHVVGLGTLALTAPDLPAGVTAIFLPDAAPRMTVGMSTVQRTLRLFSDGSMPAKGTQEIRATAIDRLPDLADVLPSIQATLTLDVPAGQLWDFVDRGASYQLTETDAIGIAMQSTGAGTDKPAIAWLEGFPGSRVVYVKRFDGTTFTASPSPGPGNGLAPTPGLAFEEARMAMTRSDVAKVVVTASAGAREGAVVVLGSASPAWSSTTLYSAPFDSHARSPRIAAGVGEALALAYMVETDPAGSSGRLFVQGTLVGPGPAPLPGPQADGSINAAADGRVLRDATAIALRGDGNPWVAWIEQPTVGLARLWLRGWDGAAWGPVLGVPTRREPVAGSLQLLVDRAGQLVVAWLESSPAKLMVARLDPASLTWTFLDNTVHADGSLNIADDQAVHDISLALDASDRLLAAWTEGGSAPHPWVKRLNAGTSWGLLGTTLSLQPTRSPFIVSDSNGQLFTAYTQYLRLSEDLSSGHVDTDVYVARWRFP